MVRVLGTSRNSAFRNASNRNRKYVCLGKRSFCSCPRPVPCSPRGHGTDLGHEQKLRFQEHIEQKQEVRVPGEAEFLLMPKTRTMLTSWAWYGSWARAETPLSGTHRTETGST